jgi:hypothetical protein
VQPEPPLASPAGSDRTSGAGKPNAQASAQERLKYSFAVDHPDRG